MMNQVAFQTEIGKICSKQSPCSTPRLSRSAHTPSVRSCFFDKDLNRAAMHFVCLGRRNAGSTEVNTCALCGGHTREWTQGQPTDLTIFRACSSSNLASECRVGPPAVVDLVGDRETTWLTTTDVIACRLANVPRSPADRHPPASADSRARKGTVWSCLLFPSLR